MSDYKGSGIKMLRLVSYVANKFHKQTDAHEISELLDISHRQANYLLKSIYDDRWQLPNLTIDRRKRGAGEINYNRNVYYIKYK